MVAILEGCQTCQNDVRASGTAQMRDELTCAYSEQDIADRNQENILRQRQEFRKQYKTTIDYVFW